MLLHEEERGVRFDMVLTHDAEDIMDPDALRWINYYAQWNDMVQIPVLALPTPLRQWTPRRLLRRVRRIPVQRHASPGRRWAASFRLTAWAQGSPGARSKCWLSGIPTASSSPAV